MADHYRRPLHGRNDPDPNDLRPRVVEMTITDQAGQSDWDRVMFEIPVNYSERPYAHNPYWRLIEVEEALLRARAAGSPDWAKVEFTQGTFAVQVPHGSELPPVSYELQQRQKTREAEARGLADARRDVFRRRLWIGLGAGIVGPPVALALTAGLIGLYRVVFGLF